VAAYDGITFTGSMDFEFSTQGTCSGETYEYGAFVSPLIFIPVVTATTVTVYFSRALRDLAATAIAANYVVSGPSTITITSATFSFPSSEVVLSHTGTFRAGTYSLTLSANTAQAVVGGQFNFTTPVNFTGQVRATGMANFNGGHN